MKKLFNFLAITVLFGCGLAPAVILVPRAIFNNQNQCVDILNNPILEYREEGIYTSIENLINGSISIYTLHAVHGMAGFQEGDTVRHDENGFEIGYFHVADRMQFVVGQEGFIVGDVPIYDEQGFAGYLRRVEV